MPTYCKQVDLPYSPRQVFDLVADVERYPLFLPHVASARIARREGNRLWVDQVVRVKLLRLSFSTQALLEPPSRISVVCETSPLGRFSEQWSFAEGPRGGTRLACRTDFELRTGFLRRFSGAMLADLLQATVTAFERRARQLYGTAASSPP